MTDNPLTNMPTDALQAEIQRREEAAAAALPKVLTPQEATRAFSAKLREQLRGGGHEGSAA